MNTWINYTTVMEKRSRLPQLATLLILHLWPWFLVGVGTTRGDLKCPQRLFSFGDSLADTGNSAEVFPEPESLFSANIIHRQTASSNLLDRIGNGRLVIDFVAEALGIPLLDPYYRRHHPDFSHGVNFAFAGATARNTSLVVPFYLYRQVNNYINFRNFTDSPGKLHNGLYWISIGSNDLLQNYVVNNLTVSQVEAQIVPDTVNSVVQAIQRLYVFGARTFMVVNIPAVGCLPVVLSNFGTGLPDDYDRLGCLISHNGVAKTYATRLRSAMDSLRLQLKGVRIMYGDYFQIHLDAVADPTKHGFDKNGTLTPCCVSKGAFPVCSSSIPHCPQPDTFVTWDGLHFTQGFNKYVATKLLSGDLKRACKLSL